MNCYDEIFRELYQFAENQPLVASHSHRMPVCELRNNNDLFKAFAWHSGSTMVSAGMEETDWEKLKDMSLPADKKWAIMKPYWEKVKYTAYGRAFLLAVNRIYGVNEITDENVFDLNAMFVKAYADADTYYNRVLHEIAKVDLTIWDYGTLDAPEGYLPAYRFESRRVPVRDAFLTTRTREDLECIEEAHNCTITDFEDYIAAFDRVFKEKLDGGMVAVKILLGYIRSLDFENVTRSEAEKVFNKIYARVLPNPGYKGFQFDGPDYKEAKILQDYLVHHLFGLATKYDVPVQIHAGFQLGKRTIESFGDPKLLNDVFIRYKKVKFVIMHTAIPYAYDLGVLAKNLNNVYVDFSWSNALSPSMTKRFFNDAIELVPIDRIIGFGDDSATLEGTLGEAINVRRMVSEVLSQKVCDGYLSVAEAKAIISDVLYNNTKRVFIKE